MNVRRSCMALVLLMMGRIKAGSGSFHGFLTMHRLVVLWGSCSIFILLVICPYYLWFGLDLEKVRMFIGEPRRQWFTPRNHFVAIGVALPQKIPTADSPVWQHVFYLPLVVAGWNRINVTALVILTGKKNAWLGSKEGPGFQAIEALKKLETKKNILYFLEDGMMDDIRAGAGQEVKLSQVARLYGALILKNYLVQTKSEDRLLDSTWLTLADADLLPVDGTRLLSSLPTGVRFRVLEPKYCCGIFNYGLKLMRMYPISYVSATLRDWEEMMEYAGDQQAGVGAAKIMGDLRTVFGRSLADSEVTHWQGASWYLDQRYLSVKLEKRIVEATKKRIEHGIVTLHRFENDDRINRLWWAWPVPGKTAKDITDAHLPIDGYKESIWHSQLVPLLRDVFSSSNNNRHHDLDYLDKYRTRFSRALYSNYGPLVVDDS